MTLEGEELNPFYLMNYSIQLNTIQFGWTKSFKGDEGLILFV